MVKIDDKDFFDTLYTQFTKTTDAADRYWMPEEVEGHGYTIWAVGEGGSRTEIGAFLFEADADFVTAIHGCTPDLVRRLHAALDEADRLDVDRDEREQEIGRLSLENMELKQEIADRSQTEDSLHDSLIELCDEIDHLKALQRDDRQTAIDAIAERDEANAKLATAKAENSYHRPLG